jgi:hypothetical protein
MPKGESVWVILRVSQYVRHLAVPAWFDSEVEALKYMRKQDKLKGCIVQSIEGGAPKK